MPKPKVIVISGPGGVGKNSIANALLAKYPAEFVAITKLTTRPIRPGERDGDEFHFTSVAEFNIRLNRGELLEHNVFNGHSYGVPKNPVNHALAAGKNPILGIDVNGARATRKHYGRDAFLIFLTAPLEDLRRRYIARGQSAEEAEKRIEIAKRDELPQKIWYDCVVENPNGRLNEVVKVIADRLHSL